MTSNLKRTRSGASNRGTRARYICFDCGRATGSTMLVLREMGPEADPYTGKALVCRTGTGCHKP